MRSEILETAIRTCYACDQPATTREHVPPISFFPQGHRTNLMTVPSCELHNNANSSNVEYTRNLVTTYYATNGVGEQHFRNKAMRSFDRNPVLRNTTFKNIRPVKFDGQDMGVYPMDVDRVRVVLNACFTALHFRETNEKIPRWEVVLTNTIFDKNVSHEPIDVRIQLLVAFSRIPFQRRQTNSPDVFEYAAAELNDGRVYAMRFYGAFVAYGVNPADVDAVASLSGLPDGN